MPASEAEVEAAAEVIWLRTSGLSSDECIEIARAALAAAERVRAAAAKVAPAYDNGVSPWGGTVPGYTSVVYNPPAYADFVERDAREYPPRLVNNG